MTNIYGITGKIGAGKSHVAQLISTFYPQAMFIEIDDIRRYILWHSTEHIHLRRELAEAFNIPHATCYYWLNRALLTEKIFFSAEALKLFSSLATPYLKQYVQKLLNNQKDMCFIIWVFLNEEGYDTLVNKTIFEIQRENINLSPMLLARKNIQLDMKEIEDKTASPERIINKEGKIFIFNNTMENNIQPLIEKIESSL